MHLRRLPLIQGCHYLCCFSPPSTFNNSGSILRRDRIIQKSKTSLQKNTFLLCYTPLNIKIINIKIEVEMDQLPFVSSAGLL